MKILFAGDCVSSGSVFSMEKDLEEYISKHDYKIINFEAPIKQDDEKPIIKAGPNLCNSENIIGCLKSYGFNVVALANNHIMDFGVSALKNTRKILKDNSIKSFGAGFSFEETYSPFFIETEDEKIAIFNLCQAEFGVMKTSHLKAGYAWINHWSINTRIKQLKELGYKIIIYAHAGIEDEEFVLPEWRYRYHELIDCGADCIIANHPHIFQGVELYKGKTIAYSLGNFYFPKDFMNNDWSTSLIASIDTKNIENISFRFVKFSKESINFYKNNEIQVLFEKRCSYVNNEELVAQYADKLAESTYNRYYKSYYENLMPHTIKQMIKNQIKKVLFGKTEVELNETMLLHNIQIESHRWCVERYLYNKNCKINNFFCE